MLPPLIEEWQYIHIVQYVSFKVKLPVLFLCVDKEHIGLFLCSTVLMLSSSHFWNHLFLFFRHQRSPIRESLQWRSGVLQDCWRYCLSFSMKTTLLAPKYYFSSYWRSQYHRVLLWRPWCRQRRLHAEDDGGICSWNLPLCHRATLQCKEANGYVQEKNPYENKVPVYCCWKFWC